MTATLLERLAASFEVTADGCWIWTKSCKPSGYGQVNDRDRIRLVHRAAYELLVGPIPAGLQLDHLCRNRPCFNPDHLEAVTPQVNTQRGTAGQVSAARAAARTHCAAGHPRTAANARPRGAGWDCRTCGAAAARRRYHSAKEAVA